jgi:hypothetical protein
MAAIRNKTSASKIQIENSETASRPGVLGYAQTNRDRAFIGDDRSGGAKIVKAAYRDETKQATIENPEVSEGMLSGEATFGDRVIQINLSRPLRGWAPEHPLDTEHYCEIRF